MPVLAVCDGCRAEYRLKDEHAGRKVKCKECGSVILVPQSEAEEVPTRPQGEGPFDYDRFLINQKRISVSEKYYVFDERQNPILFVERPAHLLRGIGAMMAGTFVAAVCLVFTLALAGAVGNPQDSALSVVIGGLGILLSIVAAVVVIVWLTPKRHVYVYADDSKGQLLLEVFQDQKISLLRATYTVNDPQNGPLGRLQKNYLSNIFRKRWDAFHPDGSVMVVAREDSLILSLLRRFLGPMLGLLRTNFIFLRPGTETVIGEFNRKVTLFDRYVLDMSADPMQELDRRMAVALGILLDTGEKR